MQEAVVFLPVELSVVFLGTAAAAPTRTRALCANLVAFEGDHLLFDCGEGCQRRLLQARRSLHKIRHLFFSHFHADHFLGFPGLVSTMQLLEREAPLQVYGPRGVKARVRAALDLAGVDPAFPVRCFPARAGTVVEEKKYWVRAVDARHTARCLGYVFEEKGKKGTFLREKAEKVLGIPPGPLYARLAAGESVRFGGRIVRPGEVMDYSRSRRGRKIAFLLDTRPVQGAALRALEGADLLVYEASFSHAEAARARETGHSTALEAARLAAAARARTLYLTHFSARYKDPAPLVKEARAVFPEAHAARDLLEVKVPVS